MELAKEQRDKNKKVDERNKKLLRKYRETGDDTYREEFFNKNDKLAYHIASRFKNTGIESEELVAFARFGMLKAFNSFDLDKDVRFATYASMCMNNEILMALRKNKKHKGVGSLEAVMYHDNKDGSEVTLMDMVEDESARGDKTHVERSGIMVLIEEVRKILNEKELVVFNNMINEEKMTQRELSDSLNLSQSYVSRLEGRIGKKARKIALKIGLVGNVFEAPVAVPKKPVTIKPEQKEEKKKELVEVEVKKSDRELVEDLMDKNPEITAQEISDEHGINKGSVYKYMSDFRKRNEEKKPKMPKPKDIEKKIIDIPKDFTIPEASGEPKPKKKKAIAKKTDLSLVSAPGSLIKNMVVSLLASLDEDEDYHIYINVEHKPKDPS